MNLHMTAIQQAFSIIYVIVLYKEVFQMLMFSDFMTMVQRDKPWYYSLNMALYIRLYDLSLKMKFKSIVDK